MRNQDKPTISPFLIVASNFTEEIKNLNHSRLDRNVEGDEIDFLEISTSQC